MAIEAGEVNVTINGVMGTLGSTLKQAEKMVGDFGSKLGSGIGGFFESSMGQIFGGVTLANLASSAVSGIVSAVKEGFAEAVGDETAMLRIKGNLESMGKSWQEYGTQMQAVGNKAISYGIDAEDAMLTTSRFARLLNGDMKNAQKVNELAYNLMATSGKSYEDVSGDLFNVLQGKGDRALKNYGAVVGKNATVTEQMNALQKAATVTMEDYSNTTEGKMKILKQYSTELKSAVGVGLVGAFTEWINRTFGGINASEGLKNTMGSLSVFAYRTANVFIMLGDAIAGAFKIAKVIPSSLKTVGDALSGGLSTAAVGLQGGIDKVFGVDSEKALNKIGISFREGLNKQIKEFNVDLKETGEAWSEAFDGMEQVGEDMGNITMSSEQIKNKLGLMGDEMTETGGLMGEAGKNANEAFSNLPTLMQDVGGSGAKAGDKVKEKLEEVRKTVNDLANDLREKLSTAFEDFGKSLKADIDEAKVSLAEVVVTAETNLKEAQDQLAKETIAMEKEKADKIKENAERIIEMKQNLLDMEHSMAKSQNDDAYEVQRQKDEFAKKQEELNKLAIDSEIYKNKTIKELNEEKLKDLQDTVDKEQAIIEASQTFRADLGERISQKQVQLDELSLKMAQEQNPIKKAMLETEISARTLAMEKLATMQSLETSIEDQRKLAGMDEFSRMEEETFRKIDIKTEDFVQETTLLRQKLEIANGVESEITAFMTEQTNVRTAVMAKFTTSIVAQMQRIGSEAKSAMAALDALRAKGGNVGGGGKAMGGFTIGGETVHSGEWVMPAWMVRAMGGMVQSLENVRRGNGISNKNINAPININAKIDGAVDARAVGREMYWELNRL